MDSFNIRAPIDTRLVSIIDVITKLHPAKILIMCVWPLIDHVIIGRPYVSTVLIIYRNSSDRFGLHTYPVILVMKSCCNMTQTVC